MNVTKKWTELKEAWTREKENLNQNSSTCTYYQILRFHGKLIHLCTSKNNKKSTIDYKIKSIS